MQELFFTTNKPRHRYKSEQFFTEYLRLKDQSTFGRVSGKQDSFFKKMLVMKKFFLWYFQIKSARLGLKLFKKAFLKKRFTFRSLTAFFHALERNILVTLVRIGFAVEMLDAYHQVLSHFVFVNGNRITTPFYVLRLGDIVETLGPVLKYVIWRKPILILIRTFVIFRLTYFFDSGCLYRLQNKVPLLRLKLFRKRKKSLFRFWRTKLSFRKEAGFLTNRQQRTSQVLNNKFGSYSLFSYLKTKIGSSQSMNERFLKKHRNDRPTYVLKSFPQSAQKIGRHS